MEQCSAPRYLMVIAWAAVCGCRSVHPVYDPEYAAIARSPLVSQVSDKSVAAAVMPEVSPLAGEHPVEEFIRYALAQNPQVQAKRKRVDAAAQRVPQAASLNDPNLSAMTYPFYPYVPQTASGRMTVDVVASQEVPWCGKLATKAEAAEAEVDMVRAELVAAKLEVIEQVKRAYYQLYLVQKSIEITRQTREVAVQFSQVAEARLQAAQVNQQDLLRAELEVANIDTELVRLRQELESAQARLARLLHVSPDTPLRALQDLPREEVPRDLQRLYSLAIAARPELHAQLAAVRRDRLATDLARLQYYPDITYSFGWGAMTTNNALAPTADGIDNLSIGVMADIPIYHKRLNAGVREAEANAVASAREYDNLRDRTQEEVKDLLAQATSQQELLQLFEESILPKARQTLEVSLPAYESGDIDFLQLTNNWQELLRYQLMQQRLEAELRQSLASLERAQGGMLPDGDASEQAPAPTPLPAPSEP